MYLALNSIKNKKATKKRKRPLNIGKPEVDRFYAQALTFRPPQISCDSPLKQSEAGMITVLSRH